MANPSSQGPKFSEYGLRYYTNSLTKEEQKDLHKWRMKNDPDYKEKVKVDRLRKKAAAEKTKSKPAAKAKTTATPKKTTTTSKVRAGKGGAGVGGMFGVKNR